MKKNDPAVPVEVFAGSIMQAEMLKSLLENAQIQTFLQDENAGTLVPWYTAPGGAGSVKVIVSSADYEKARSVVGEFEARIAESD
jgi:hypothetical protein